MQIGRDVGDDILGNDEEAALFLRAAAVTWLPARESKELLDRCFLSAPEGVATGTRLDRIRRLFQRRRPGDC